MKKRAPTLQRAVAGKEATRSALADLKQDVTGWSFTGNMAGWSSRTRTERAWWMERLQQFLEAEGMEFTREGVSAWLLALQAGTERRCRGPLKPGSLATAQRVLRAFDSWRLRENLVTVGVMARIPAVIVRDDQVHPFDDHEVRQLLCAAKTVPPRRPGDKPTAAPYALRDTAILLTLLDTGLRASELCALTVADADLSAGMLTIRSGKGSKARYVPIQPPTVAAIFTYLRDERRTPNDPLFTTARGEAMQRNTLRLLMDRLQDRTGIHCHAHRWRHTSACSMLRNGAHAPAVKAMLGHTRMAATERYVSLNYADLAAVHKTASPVANFAKKGR